MYEYYLKDILNYNKLVDIISNIKKELKTNILKIQVLTNFYDDIIDEFTLDTIYFDIVDLYTQLKEIFYYNDDKNIYVSISK
jgi:hypothetical protein